MLGGSVLGVWSHIEEVFNRCSAHNQRMQIIRVKTQNKRLVGECQLNQQLKSDTTTECSCPEACSGGTRISLTVHGGRPLYNIIRCLVLLNLVLGGGFVAQEEAANNRWTHGC